ncbi:hypothetical protein HY989_05300 [Candidatus Micrarchaeota archaeon]|nr:hypothetical protein [Candidatus Micrarchaeota archaeon]
MARLSKSLTSIERDVIITQSPLDHKEQRGWREAFVRINSFGTRVEALRNMADVIENKMGLLLHGISRKSDALSRLRTASVIANLPKEIAVDHARAGKIINAQNHSDELAKELASKISTVVPVKSINSNIMKHLSPEYIANLFTYSGHYRSLKDSTQKENSLFEKVNSAFLEKGVDGVKEVKYHSEEAKEIQQHSKIPDSIIRFLESLDSHVGATDSNKQLTSKATIFESYQGKLGDYKLHLKEEGDPARNHSLESEQEKSKKDLNSQIELLEKKISFSHDFKKLVAGGEYSNAFDAIKKTHESATNLEKQHIAKVLQPLDRLTKLSKIDEAREAIKIGQEIVSEILALEKVDPESQIERFEKLRQKHPEEKIEKYAKTLKALGKNTYNDLAYFLEELKRRPESTATEVETKITHNAMDHFTLGKFENNCQSPKTPQCRSLISNSAELTELVLGHYGDAETSSGKEFIGFSFAHLLKGREGYLLAVERPYSHQAQLKPKMQENINRIIEQINSLAYRQKVPISAALSEIAKNATGYSTIPTHVKKYYDMKSGFVD